MYIYIAHQQKNSNALNPLQKLNWLSYSGTESYRKAGTLYILQLQLSPQPPIGGTTVLKVGGGNFASGASQKKLTPHFLASGGTKYCLDS